jgi:hypothetical protein
MTPSEIKSKLVEALKENHIVLLACRKIGVGKSSYYRFRKSDPKFARKADEAIKEGVALVNDAAEGTIIGAIREKNIDATKFWLTHRHPEFKNNIIQAGIDIAENNEGESILQIFAELKPKTREMLKPYLKNKLKSKKHGKSNSKK